MKRSLSLSLSLSLTGRKCCTTTNPPRTAIVHRVTLTPSFPPLPSSLAVSSAERQVHFNYCPIDAVVAAAVSALFAVLLSGAHTISSISRSSNSRFRTYREGIELLLLLVLSTYFPQSVSRYRELTDWALTHISLNR